MQASHTKYFGSQLLTMTWFALCHAEAELNWAEPSRAELSWAEPSRAEPSRAEPTQARLAGGSGGPSLLGFTGLVSSIVYL